MNLGASGPLTRTLVAAPSRSAAVRYGSPILLVGVALFLTSRFTDPTQAPYFPLLLAAVALSAAVGGFGPGIFATCMAGVLGFYALVPPRFTWSETHPGDITRSAIFLPAGLFISWLIGAYIASRAELQRSEEQFRQLADAMPQMVWTARPDGFFDYYNSKWYERTQLVEGAYGDESWKRLLHPDDVDRCTAHWSYSVHSGDPYEIEYRYKDHDGRYRWYLGRAVPVRNSSARIVKWIGTCTDIEGIKATQNKLLRAEKLAAAGKLAASIAHELNTPLGAVLNLVYLAQHENNGQRKNEYLAEAEHELGRVSRLANRCLSIYRGGTSKTTVRFNDLIDEVVGVFQNDAVSRGISIDKKTGGTLTVFGSPDDLRQVIANLISNAIDALCENGVLKVSAKYSKDWKTARPCVRLVVADNGTGIADQAKKMLFDPFFTTKREAGTGLGLWITRNIVENHGGTICVRSSTRRNLHGTVVSACLPVADVAAPTSAS